MSDIQYTEEDRTYRLKAGSHVEYKGKNDFLVLEPGDTLTTKVNMIRLHGPDRWERINQDRQESLEELRARIRLLESAQQAQQAQPKETSHTVDSDLSSKTIKQLRQFAEDMEPPVELAANLSKDEIIAAIQSAIDAA